MSSGKKTIGLIILLFIFLVCFNPPCRADVVQKHRFVVLVYDDSGSMSQNHSSNWEKANYSLQSLAGLLDSGDKLYVVKMSQPESPEEIPLEAKARQAAIDKIRNTVNAGENTPFETIRTAAKLLEQTSSDYERWLVISSDGQFQISKDEGCSGDQFSEFLETYKNKTGNSSINMVFLAIGNQVPNDLKIAWGNSVGQAPLEAVDADGIIARMNEIAALITSRDPEHAEDSQLQLEYKNNNTVAIQSPFPLRRLTIIRQSVKDSSLILESMQVNGKSVDASLNVSGPYAVGTPIGGNEVVAGHIMHVTLNSSVLPEGTYNLTFNQDVSKDRENIKFLAEAAIDFNCAFYKKQGSKYIKVSNANANVGDTVQARIQILRAGESKPMPIDKIANQVEASVKINGQKEINLQANLASDTFIANGIKLEQGIMNARFTLTVRGWYKNSKYITLNIVQLQPRNLGLRVEPDNWNASLKSMESAGPIRLVPTVDGRPMTEEKFAEIKDNLHLQGSKLKIKVSQEKNSFILQPQRSFGGAAFTPVGLQTVNAELQGRVADEKAQAAVSILIKDIPWYEKYGPLIAWPLVIILLLVYVLGLIKKPRFYKDNSYVNHISEISNYDWERVQPRAELLKSNWFSRYLVPYQAETVEIGSLTFIATGHVWSVKVDRESLGRVLEQEGTGVRLAGSTITVDDLNADLIMSSNDELVIQRRNPDTKEWFKYLT